MALKLASTQQTRHKQIESAVSGIMQKESNLDEIRTRISKAMTDRTSTWLAAGINDGFTNHYQAQQVPEDFTVIAADGSHIDVDRNYSTHCFLINTGMVRLSYGKESGAQLTSSPSLYFEDADFVLTAADGTRRSEVIQGPLLGAKRSVEECRSLAQAAAGTQGKQPLICLLDGSLVLWGLNASNYPDFVVDTLVRRDLMRCFSEFKSCGKTRPLALAAYISFPRNTEVINAIRLAVCPFPTVDCDRNCPPSSNNRPCDSVAGLLDRDIFNRILQPGERSATFSSLSRIVTECYSPHPICFFYMKADDEIARVELPEWVATEPILLSLAHAIILDQCRRGCGYPVSLSEAHEQAVVSGHDRDEFWNLVERALSERRMELHTSIKSQSKRTRWI
jgi:hypothetical protein